MERGTLVRWNDEKGFGFIKPEAGNDQDVFIHISALKHMARKPKVGDEIVFHRENQPDGKVKAIKASIEGVAVIASSQHPSKNNTTNSPHRPSQRYNHSASSPILGRMFMIIIFLGVGIFGYKQYEKMTAVPVLTNADIEQMQWEPSEPNPSAKNLQPQFRCETGKIHCSQMRSCAEATFYINNCPGTEMDGDRDGVPCERQHCGNLR
ncbi:excalibur calcium-binding domain-containing protein [Shewanella inventionis]|uniref:Cold-shock protein n=1 Tax=Shewanella inventionis TaxID=1738770 RepID=A0ABQ1JQI3_9GAMM|nr:excalibur calcium-binding domain-containing protein [Shewanella inventionis]MCL1159378.1 excalibur calcium-binding domain-containing protein [Shewanella inventionis]UAL44133.1 excalibur calcium-binding domain-containing protein [Shewanella inventionis]GGB72126.1 cold-shock protein [Shewanella inventionis]